MISRRVGRVGRVALGVAVAAIAAQLTVAAPAAALSTGVVISQVYGGGGNPGAPYLNDYVELFNRGAVTVSLTGWSFQYASATGSTWAVTSLSGSVAPGSYFLLGLASGGANGMPLPTPDAPGTTNMGSTAGKVALVNTTAPLMGTVPAGPQIIDFVGYGATASAYEGGGPAPAPSNTTADVRGNGGCMETDVNSSDFSVATPAPRNSAFAPPHSCRRVAGDFDGDGKADIAVFRPSEGFWYIHGSAGSDSASNWGEAGDIPVPGDYDGDGRTDRAIYRPDTGLWAIHPSGGGADMYVTFGGAAGDVAVPADYDGDGKADIAIYRPSAGFWFTHRSSDGQDRSILFGGIPGDIPLAADFSGDGRADKVIFRPSTGTWYVHPTGSDEADFALSYGAEGDIPLPADYDGDGIADLAIFRPSTGLWAVHGSATAVDTFVTYGGVGGDVAVPGDYDSDGLADIAIFRPSLGAWYVHQSTDGFDAITTFGIDTDIALILPAAVRLTFYP